MKTGSHGIDVMHFYETCVLRAYPDPASPMGRALQAAGLWNAVLQGRVEIPARFNHLGGAPWTIGYGDTGPDVVRGLVITHAEADARFARRLAREFEPGVLNAVQRNPTRAHFDAMVSLAYNIGLANFRSSTLLRKYNLGDVPGADAQFPAWNKAQGQVLLGLKRRRASEQALFRGKPAAEAISIGQEIAS